MTDTEELPGNWRLDWPTSTGAHVGRARLKSHREDFQVDEDLGLEGFPSQDYRGTFESAAAVDGGEHLCLRLEKVGDNTEYVARELASLAGCRTFDVGFCGLKDRHAVTRQWFSLYRPGLKDDDAVFIERVAERWPVLSSCRFRRKLRRGEHRANGFVIRLRSVEGERAGIDAALTRLAEQGAPNYFGPQRFGIGGANLDRAAAMDPSAMKLSKGRTGGRGRRGKGRTGGDGAKNVLYFSAARSWIFNEVLAQRVQDANWLTQLSGDPSLASDYTTPTGPLWGDGGTLADDSLGELERRIAAQAPSLLQLFSTTRMKPERRPLVAKPETLTWVWLADGSLQLTFALAPGQYATTVLGDLFELEDMSLGRHNKQQG